MVARVVALALMLAPLGCEHFWYLPPECCCEKPAEFRSMDVSECHETLAGGGWACGVPN